MKISKEKYINADAVLLETEDIKVYVLLEFGFKIASIYHKGKDKELLSQPRKGEYEMPVYGERFSKYDASGLNDMIPTLESCEYPDGFYEGITIPDRGEVWSRQWDMEIVEDGVKGSINLKTLPVKFSKYVTIKDGNTISIDYEIENLADKEVKYLWTLQSLNVCDDDTEFIFQDDMKNIINVKSNEDLTRLDYKKISEFRDSRFYKFFFWGQFKEGKVGIDYTKDRIKYIIEYDIKKHPHVGVFVDKKYGKCSVEPSNGFFDSVSVAHDNFMVTKLDGMEKDSWNVLIKIEDY